MAEGCVTTPEPPNQALPPPWYTKQCSVPCVVLAKDVARVGCVPSTPEAPGSMATSKTHKTLGTKRKHEEETRNLFALRDISEVVRKQVCLQNGREQDKAMAVLKT